jgi:hypothetical protein
MRQLQGCPAISLVKAGVMGLRAEKHGRCCMSWRKRPRGTVGGHKTDLLYHAVLLELVPPILFCKNCKSKWCYEMEFCGRIPTECGM